MAYATDEQIRKICNFTTNEISDLTEQIAAADKWLLSRITTKHELEAIDGIIDGSNTEFRVQEWPIADDDLDATVDKDDVEVFYATYSDPNQFIVYGAAQTVTSVVANDGIINVETAPTSTTAECGVFANFRTWNVYEVDYDKFKLIASFAAAGFAQQKIMGAAPNYHIIEKNIRKNVAGGFYFNIAESMVSDIVKPAAGVVKHF